MSDNVIRPERWLANAAASLEAEASDTPPDGELGGGGGGPHDPIMEARVAKLETNVDRLVEASVRIEEALKHLATAAELATVKGAVVALDARVGRVETAVDRALQTALGKAIGPYQLPTIIIGTAVILAGLAYGYQWLAGHPLLPPR